ncbi:aldehyde dehydrogenase family protein [Streptomyces sp. NPDC058469]|uniref:aldehyde dehydrogenase family protein n=1 Tax=Streptomyces sp. NPDC058469 TaxID=3346514 RepID=UPI00365135C2
MQATSSYPSPDLIDYLRRDPLGHVIDGITERGDQAGTHPVLDPSSGRTIATIGLGTARDVDRAVASARTAFPEWRARTPAQRATALFALADLIQQNAELLAQLESMNVGKPLATSRDEIPGVVDTFRLMAGAARTGTTPGADEYAEGHLSFIRRQPLGVVAAITPWNYPLLTAAWKVAPALAAGNTVVVKPSELTPLTTVLFAELAAKVLPAGAVNVVLGDGDGVGRPLAEHPEIDMISLTGSVDSGVAVAASAAATLKRVHLELGGKAPVIVFGDADLTGVAQSLRTAAYWNAGQECGAATRVLCEASVAKQLTDELKATVATLRSGGPGDGEEIELGPLVSEQHLARVDALVQDAIERGATAVLGGGRDISRPGFFFQPTILTDIPAGSAIATAEIFGPVVTIETFEGEAEAIDKANDSRYGLSASVWTENGRRGLRVVEELDYGTVWLNSHLVLANEMPWGGFGASGNGREQSAYAIEEFSRTKHVMLAK